MTNYFKTNQDGFGAEDANAAMLLYGMGETQVVIALPRNLEDGVFPTTTSVVKAEFATIEIIKDDNITITDTIISLASGDSGRATIRVYPNILPLKTWDIIQWSSMGGTVTCNIKKDMGQTTVATNISNPLDLQGVEIGGEYVDFEFTLTTGAELGYVTFIFTGGMDSELMTSFGKTNINQASLGFKGMNALVWQRKYKKGLFHSGQSIKFYYNTTISNGNNLFEVEIWKDGSKITTSGQLTHVKNTRRVCEVKHIFDPRSEYILKVISKTTGTVVLESIQISDCETGVATVDDIEYPVHVEEGTGYIHFSGTVYACTTMAHLTYVEAPKVRIQGYSNSGLFSANTNVPGVSSSSLCMQRVDGASHTGDANFSYHIRGLRAGPFLIA